MTTRQEPARPDYLTATQTAERLGISVRTLDRWVTQGFLRPIPWPGRARRFRPADVDALRDPAN